MNEKVVASKCQVAAQWIQRSFAGSFCRLNSPQVLRQLEPLVIELFPGVSCDPLMCFPFVRVVPRPVTLGPNPIRIVRSLPLPWNGERCLLKSTQTIGYRVRRMLEIWIPNFRRMCGTNSVFLASEFLLHEQCECTIMERMILFRTYLKFIFKIN